MTHDPRLPTLEAVMNGSPYELVDTPFSKDKMEAWRAQSIATGVGGALAAMHQLYQLVRNDAADAATRADEAQAREALVHHLCDQVAEMQERINRLADTLEARQRADAETARQEAERRRQLEEDPLEDPPDIAEFQALNPPAEIGDDTHQPGGELHSVAAKEDPDLEVEDDDDQGDLPEELTKNVAPAPSNYPSFELPKPSVVSQPVSISLNKE
jgi:TolA-binding protein